ncbi:MAG: transcriptional regulator PpsR [Myxococcota bacterium]
MSTTPRTANGIDPLAAADSLAARIVRTCSDLALVVDDQGVIEGLSLGQTLSRSHDGESDVEAHWRALVGRRWSDTLMKDSRGKVDQLLREANQGETKRGREVNQVVDGVGEIPFRFAGASLGDGRAILLGRDLRPMAELQQRMVSTQQAMELEYSRLRQADTRYRVLFHVSGEGVLVAQSKNRRIVECNPAAAKHLGGGAPVDVQGKTIDEVFGEGGRARVQALAAAVEAGAESEVQFSPGVVSDRGFVATASMFRQSGETLLLFRFWPAGGTTSNGARTSRMLTVLDAMPDGFVVTTDAGDVLSANPAFCELVQRATEKQVVGQRLDRWLGRPGVDLNIMLTNIREHGVLKNFATIVRGDFGGPQEAVVTGVSALDAKVPCLGFSIRVVSSRLSEVPTSSLLPRSVDQLRELVGRVSLKEIVRESTDLIERLCIEAALDVSGNNRAAAAQLLGLSRQGLYSKLRRHNIAESS